MALIRNTFVFLDTKFFKDYKPKEPAYCKFLEFSRDDKISLCTSYICIEEWRTQKVSHLNKTLEDMGQRLADLRKSNFIAKELLDPETHKKFPDYEQIVKQSGEGVEYFVDEYKIHVYKPKEEHIWATWSAYFNGHDPFKQVKNRKDIPDAWILECARDALSDKLYKNVENKFCIAEDNALCDALNKMDFETITVLELVERLEKEEMGVVPETELATMEALADKEKETIKAEDMSPLDVLLSKAINATTKGIYLRLLGFVVPLDTPSHESLIDTVVSKGYDRKLTEACAVILSDKSKPYIKDTGSHYIVGDKEICTSAADRLTQEIIDMLD